MGNVLPMRIPPSETYQCIAFVMGIMLEDENVKEAFYNHYIRLRCDRFDENQLRYVGCEAEDIRVEGIAELNKYYIKNQSPDKIIGFLEERLDQGDYLLLFWIDEYYLPYSEFYNVRHFHHDTHVYGYDDECFYVMAYRDLHLQKMKVKKEHIAKSLAGGLAINPEGDFCAIKFHGIKVKCSIKTIASEVKEYLSGGYDEATGADGIDSYKTIKDIMSDCTENPEDEMRIDPKLLRMLWEHKKIFSLRNQFLSEKIEGLKALQKDVDDLVRDTSMMMLMALKFNKNQDISIPERIKEYADDLYEREERYLREFLAVLSEYEVSQGDKSDYKD